MDRARFRVHFDSLPYDKPDEGAIEFGFGAGGKVWSDDAEFVIRLEGDETWSTRLKNFDNWYFRDEGSGYDAFEHWTLDTYDEPPTSYPPGGANEYVETNNYRAVLDPGIYGAKSRSIDHGPVLGDDNYHVMLDQSLGTFGSDFAGLWDYTKFLVAVHARAKYIDTYRLGNVWQWQYILDRYGYLEEDPGREKALGIILYADGFFVFYNRPNDLPEDPGGWPDGDALGDWDYEERHGFFYKVVNGRAAEAAMAEWSWSLKKPRRWDDPGTEGVDEGIFDTPKLANLWYCPYYIHQRERTWLEKK